MKATSRRGPRTNALLVASGLTAVGAGSAVALAVGARALETADFAVFATWWTMANLVGLAFVAIEVYLPRPLLTLRAAGSDERPLIRTFTRTTVFGATAIGTLLVALSGWIVPTLLDGRVGLLPLMLAYLLGAGLQSVQRAVAIGRGHFRLVAIQLGSDGAVRAAGSLALAASGDASATGFAVVLCTAVAVGVLAGAAADRHWWGWSGPRAPLPLRPVAMLSAASVGPLLVNNASVPWLTALQDVPPVTVGAVAGALTLSRIPTLLVGAAYGPVVAPLAVAADAGLLSDFRNVHRRAVITAGALAGLFVAAFALAGPSLLQLYLGPGFRLSRLELGAMAAGSGLMFVSVVEQAALVALAAWDRSALAWTAAVAAFISALAVPGDPVERVALAVFAAPLVAVILMARSRRRAVRLHFGPAVLRDHARPQSPPGSRRRRS